MTQMGKRIIPLWLRKKVIESFKIVDDKEDEAVAIARMEHDVGMVTIALNRVERFATLARMTRMDDAWKKWNEENKHE